VRLLPIDFREAGNQILAEKSYALELIVENPCTPAVQLPGYLADERSVFSGKGNRDLVWLGCLNPRGSSDRSSGSSSVRRTMFQKQFTDASKVSILEEEISYDGRLIHSKLNSSASGGNAQELP
jgi:hypothetical protein